jgi:hypothetical protein
MLKRILKITAWTALGVVLVTGGLVAAFYVHFRAAPARPSNPQAFDTLAAEQEDLDYFGKLIALDRAFTPSARAAADRRLGRSRGAPRCSSMSTCGLRSCRSARSPTTARR